jgi:hypothetical protein
VLTDSDGVSTHLVFDLIENRTRRKIEDRHVGLFKGLLWNRVCDQVQQIDRAFRASAVDNSTRFLSACDHKHTSFDGG